MGRPITSPASAPNTPVPAGRRDVHALLHAQCLATLHDRLSVVPIPPASSTLALGAGTDIWAADVARRHPEARARSSPDVSAGLEKCRPRARLHLVYIRGASGHVRDWRAFYRQARQRLRPGGWIEQVECSLHLREATSGALSRRAVLARWSQLAVAAATETGRTLEVAENMAGLMREAGFERVAERRFRWPVGGASQLGRLNRLRWEAGMEEWVGEAYATALGWSPQQTRAWLEQVKAALREERDGVWQEV